MDKWGLGWIEKEQERHRWAAIMKRDNWRRRWEQTLCCHSRWNQSIFHFIGNLWLGEHGVTVRSMCVKRGDDSWQNQRGSSLHVAFQQHLNLETSGGVGGPLPTCCASLLCWLKAVSTKGYILVLKPFLCYAKTTKTSMEASQAAELGKENAFTLKDCFVTCVFLLLCLN